MRKEKWMYKVVALPMKMFTGSDKKAIEYEGLLNQEGLTGWELVNVVIDSSGYTYAYFKK